MKPLVLFVLVLTVNFTFSQNETLDELKQYTATEHFPADTVLKSIKNKKALVIVAHDDDDCMMSGTITQLKLAGWQIEQVCLSHTRLPKKAKQHPHFLISDGSSVLLKTTPYRVYNMDENARPTYEAFPKKDFDTVFNYKVVTDSLLAFVNTYKPSVIFTLDNDIGAYGNPDHVFLSQLVLDLFQQKKFPSTEYIYQSVITKHMEQKIIAERLMMLMGKWGFDPEGWNKTKAIYQVDGMPQATTEINIEDVAELKMNYLLAYHEDAKKNIRKFQVNFDSFEATEYFAIFNREFFRVISKAE